MLMPSSKEGCHGTYASFLSLLSERSGNETWQDRYRETALSVPKPGVFPSILPARSGVQGALTGDQTASDRDASQWQWHPRYGTRVEDEHGHGDARIEKNGATLESVNTSLLHRLTPSDVDIMIRRIDEADVDEMWSFVGKKQEQRWLWHAIDHRTGEVLAYVFGRRQDAVFLQLKALLEPFRITRLHRDYWGAYGRHLDPEAYHPGKRNTQNIERKHLTLRTRIKRLMRKTICFSKAIEMHDIIIGLFVNRYACDLPV
jgi:insertion element IS1 protein InsB